MRTVRSLLGVSILFLSIAGWGAGHTESNDVQTLTGEVIDTICAGYKGHDRMMQQMKSMGTDKKTCVQKCLQLGGKYALYDAANGTVYTITNPEKVEAFAGQQVEITGTLDKKKLTITEIKAAD